MHTTRFHWLSRATFCASLVLLAFDGRCQADCAPPPQGLISWWRAEGNASDSVSANDGILRSGAAFASGKVGQAFLFNGSGQFIEIANSPSLNPAGSLTIEGWILPRENRTQGILGKWGYTGDTPDQRSYIFDLRADGRLEFAISDAARQWDNAFHVFQTPDPVVTLDVWHHVAAVYDQSTGTRLIYVNGVEVARRTDPPITILNGTSKVSIGAWMPTSTTSEEHFNGFIDELSLYDRALSAEEIQAIVAAGSQGKCQDFPVTLSLSVEPGGAVTREPELDLYPNGSTVTLTAMPDAGFAFTGWSGDVSSVDNPLLLTLERNTRLTAMFSDVAGPEIVMTSPIPGETHDERFVLSGSVTDNVAVSAVRWEWNAQDRGVLPLTDSVFVVEGLRFTQAENHICVFAVDPSDNETIAEVFVTWTPSRTLEVVTPAPVQEGQRVNLPLELVSEGDVGGMSFLVRYNADFLGRPELTWSSVVGSALNQVNTETPGELRATFALPAIAVPAGVQPIALISFRARSVPFSLSTQLDLEVLDVADPTGTRIESGTAAASGEAMIAVRSVVGDNNANARLDIGDATVIQRLLTGLDPVRAWDTAANDVNQNAALDSGDVVRVLRTVVGLDPQPLGPQDAGGLWSPPRVTDTKLRRQDLRSDAGGGSIRLSLDTLHVEPGELVTVQVQLEQVVTGISGIALRLDYPTNALRLLDTQSHRSGPLVPPSALVLWNVEPAQDNYLEQTGTVLLAISSPTPWPQSNGVLAEFTFQVQSTQDERFCWPILLTQAELSPDGYDILALPDTEVCYVGREAVAPRFDAGASAMTEAGFELRFQGEPHVDYLIEASTDLIHWEPCATLRDDDGELTYTDDGAKSASYRFYRILQQ